MAAFLLVYYTTQKNESSPPAEEAFLEIFDMRLSPCLGISPARGKCLALGFVLWGTIGGGAVLAQGFNFGSDPPWAVESPGGVGSTFGLGTEYLSERQGRLEIRSTHSVLTLLDREHGIVTTMIENGDPALLQRKFDVEWRAQGPGVTVPLRLPSLHLPGGGGIYSSLVLDASTADVTLDFHDKPEQPANSDSLHGRGPMYGLGLDVIGAVCNRCPWYAVGYQWRNFPSLTVDRSPHFFAPGFNVLGDKVRLNRKNQSFSTRIGYTLPGNRVATYVGVRRFMTGIVVQDKVSLGSQTLPEETALSSLSKFASSRTEKVVGIDVHLGGPFFARSEFAFGDRQREGLLRLIYLKSPPEEKRIISNEREGAIADAIVPGLAHAREIFESRWRNLSIVEGPGSTRYYLLREVDALLVGLLQDILKVLNPYPELQALGDWAMDEINHARTEISRTATGASVYSILGHSRTSRASLAQFTSVSAYATGLSLARSEEHVQVDKVNVILRDTKNWPLAEGTIETKARNHELTMTLTFKTDVEVGAKLLVYPRFRKKNSPATSVLPTNRPTQIYRGSYSFEVIREKILACDARKPGAESATPCPLILVAASCRVLVCTVQECNDNESCKP